MSLKAGWDPADDPHIDKCEVIAAWKGYLLQAAGDKWTLIPAGQPKSRPVITGTLEDVEAFLVKSPPLPAIRPSRHRWRPVKPATGDPPEIDRAASLAVLAHQQGLALRPDGDKWTIGPGVSTRLRRAPIVVGEDRLRLVDGREAPLRMTLDEVAVFLREGQGPGLAAT